MIHSPTTSFAGLLDFHLAKWLTYSWFQAQLSCHINAVLIFIYKTSSMENKYNTMLVPELIWCNEGALLVRVIRKHLNKMSGRNIDFFFIYYRPTTVMFTIHWALPTYFEEKLKVFLPYKVSCPSLGLSTVNWSFSWSACHNLLQMRKATLPCSYRGTCLILRVDESYSLSVIFLWILMSVSVCLVWYNLRKRLLTWLRTWI